MYQIVICKIISGDLIVGKLEQRDTGQFITEVYSLIFHPSQSNPKQLTSMIIPILAPFDDKAIKELSVDKFVVAMADASPEVQKTYIKLTTGLDVEIPSKIIQ